MGRKLIAEMVSTLDRLQWGGNPAPTPVGRQVYDVALDQVDSYRGDPKVLGAAIRTLQTCNSLPYTYAGLAYTLAAAASEEDGKYDAAGLEKALEWLEKAQELAPDVPDINVVEAYVYIYQDRFEDARIVLDYLADTGPLSYYLCRAETAFWRRSGDVEQALQWSEYAMEAAVTLPQRLRINSQTGDLFLEQGEKEKAIQAYREAAHFDPDNAELYHKLSELYLEQGAHEEAANYNRRALALEPDYAEALAVREQLDEESKGLVGRLFGR